MKTVERARNPIEVMDTTGGEVVLKEAVQVNPTVSTVNFRERKLPNNRSANNVKVTDAKYEDY